MADSIANQKNEKMATMPLGRLLFQLALPAVVAQIVNFLYNIVDRIFIGHIPEIGALALTGAGLFVPILQLITAFACLVCTGGAPYVGIMLGKGDREQAEKVLGNCFSAILLISLMLTTALYMAAPSLLRFFGASEETIGYALQYARIYIIGTPVVMITSGMNYFISAQGFATTAMLSTMIGAGLNILLDPILIFSAGMGAAGAAIATDLSQCVSAVWVLAFLFGRKTTIRIRWEKLRLDRSILLPVLGLGLSTFVMMSTESLLSICFNHSLAKYGGDLAVGAMTIITSINSLISFPLHGLNQGGTPIISYNYGAGNRDRVWGTFYRLLGAAFVYSVSFWLLTQFCGRQLAGIFTTDVTLQDYAARCMRIYFAVTFSWAFQTTCQQSFVALGQAKISLFMACLRKLILLIPLILILPVFFEDKVFAVFVAEPISDAIAAAVTTGCFFWKIRRLLPLTDKAREEKST